MIIEVTGYEDTGITLPNNEKIITAVVEHNIETGKLNLIPEKGKGSSNPSFKGYAIEKSGKGYVFFMIRDKYGNSRTISGIVRDVHRVEIDRQEIPKEKWTEVQFYPEAA